MHHLSDYKIFKYRTCSGVGLPSATFTLSRSIGRHAYLD